MAEKALIAGASGLVGGFLVRLLAETRQFDELIALHRKGSKIVVPGVTAVEIDMDYLDDYREKLIGEVVFCCLGTTMKKAKTKKNFYTVDFTYPYELAKIAFRNGCKQFNIITASGANIKSFFYYNRVKGEIEHAVGQIGFPSVNIFRPSFLLGKRNEKRIGEQAGAAVAKVINPLLVGTAKKYRAVQAETVAKAMIRLAHEYRLGVNIWPSDLIQQYGRDA
jgi:uncharacterized protein YbjT (DUF2867 family)